MVYCVKNTLTSPITDVNECSVEFSLENPDDVCSADATCKNTPGDFECACNFGFRGDGFNCIGKSMFTFLICIRNILVCHRVSSLLMFLWLKAEINSSSYMKLRVKFSLSGVFCLALIDLHLLMSFPLDNFMLCRIKHT